MEEVKVTLGSCTKFNFSRASEQDLIEFAAEDNVEALKELERRGAFKKPVKG